MNNAVGFTLISVIMLGMSILCLCNNAVKANERIAAQAQQIHQLTKKINDAIRYVE